MTITHICIPNPAGTFNNKAACDGNITKFAPVAKPSTPADDITKLEKLLNSDELTILFVKESDDAGRSAFNYWLISSEEILNQIIPKLTKINIISLRTGGDKFILKLNDKDFYIILTDDNMIVLLNALKKYKKDVLFFDKTNKALGAAKMRGIKPVQFKPSNLEPSSALIVSEHPVAPTADLSTQLGQVVAQGSPTEFKLKKTTKNDYLFYEAGLHSFGRYSWFKDYFGLDEQIELKTELPNISTSFTQDIIKYKYKPELSYINVKNITFTIKGTLYKVGDFSCLPLVDLKTMENYPVFEDTLPVNITYKVIDNDITYLINHSEPTDVFQAASQLNLLEMPDANTKPEAGITEYYGDRSQGPRVALASPIGTFFRNYLIYDGKPQTSTEQFNTLFELLHLPEFNFKSVSTSTVPKQGQYVYSNGYCFINPTEAQSKMAQDNPQLFDQYLKVGVQWNSPLLIDYTRKLCQVYCSGLPFAANYAGPYKTDLTNPLEADYKTRIKPFAIGILKAAFKCTLQVAVNKLHLIQSGGKIKVYLTPVGGGFFGNPIKWVAEALINALIDFRQYPLDVQMVIFTSPFITQPLNIELLEEKFINASIQDGSNFPISASEELEKRFNLYIEQSKKRKYIKYKTKYLELKNQLGK